MVSVALDGDAWKQFSGIRVIIAYEPSDLLRDVVSLSVNTGNPLNLRSNAFVDEVRDRLCSPPPSQLPRTHVKSSSRSL